MYKQLTKYIGKLNKGEECINPTQFKYDLCNFGYDARGDDFMKHYAEIYREKWNDYELMIEDDVSVLGGEDIISALLAVMVKDRFSDGYFLFLSDKGIIDRWLIRLKELDEKKIK